MVRGRLPCCRQGEKHQHQPQAAIAGRLVPSALFTKQRQCRVVERGLHRQQQQRTAAPCCSSGGKQQQPEPAGDNAGSSSSGGGSASSSSGGGGSASSDSLTARAPTARPVVLAGASSSRNADSGEFSGRSGSSDEAGDGSGGGGGGGGWRLSPRDELLRLSALLPPQVRDALESHPEYEQLLEVVLDLGRPPLGRFLSGDARLSDSPVTADDLAYAVSAVGEFGGDNRGGIDRTLHRVSCIRNRLGHVVGLTCRAGRAVPGSAALVADLITEGRSLLLLGRPGVGKTTAIRDIASMLAGGSCGAKRVVVVDTSNEIGGDGDIPHPGIGGARRMQVPDPELQHRVMIEAVENHTPQAIIIDEVGTEAEALACRTIAQRGVQLVATAHGNRLANVLKNPALADLVGGVAAVTLGDDEARRRGGPKSVLERQGPPTFDAAVEMIDRRLWVVHPDVAAAVDSLLAGGSAPEQLRELRDDGSVLAHTGRAADRLRAEAAAASGTAMGLGADSPFAPGSAMEAQRLASAGAFAMRSAAAAVGQFSPAAAAALGDGFGYADEDDYYSDDDDSSEGSGADGEDGEPGGSVGEAGGVQLVVYLFGLEQPRVAEAAAALRLPRRAVRVTDRLTDADAVLALRSKIKAGGWVRMAAKQVGVPIYTIKSGSKSNLARALRTLLGQEPSAGGTFLGASAAAATPPSYFGGDPAAAVAATRVPSWEEGDMSAGQGQSGVPGAEDSSVTDEATAAAGAAAASASGRRVSLQALEEARLAVEQFVLGPGGQPIELLPREADVLDLQVDLVRSYGLEWEAVGAEPSRRLRILPAGFDSQREQRDQRQRQQPAKLGAEFW